MPGERRDQTVLDSWKGIAAYFGVTVRTVQNWESTRGLPVHRLPGPGGRVWARTDELEVWSSTGQTQRRRPRWFAWLAAGSLVAALGSAAVMLSNGTGELAECHFAGQFLIATDGHGKELWRHPLGSPLRTDWKEELDDFPRLTPVIEDLNGDGEREVMYAHMPPLESGESAALVALSAAGKRLWRFEPGRAISTLKETFGPPFNLFGFLVIPHRSGKPTQILAVAYHRLYYPTQVALLSSEGKLLREYWHSGHLSVFEPAHPTQGNAVYMGGIANVHNSAVLVALDPATMEGASQEENTDYQLLGFGPPRERARILLPRTRLAEGRSRYNGVAALRVQALSFAVGVNDAFAPDPRANPVLMFEFDLRLRCTGVGPVDNFYSYYRALGRDERLTERDLEALRQVRYLTRP